MVDTSISGTDEVVENKSKEITLQTLLANGAHYGHSTTSWCPKMAPYLYGTKSVVNYKRRYSAASKDVYIFNLDLTLRFWRKARELIVNNASTGGSMLLVGTKAQCREVVEREAERSGCFYVNHKWVGGVLTNFDTTRQSVARMDEIERLLVAADNTESKINFTKKERLVLQRELDKLNKKFGGIRNMTALPAMVFVVDVCKNAIAVTEAKKLNIPVIGITDSNADPDKIDHIIPANDDAAGTIDLILTNVADAVLEGKAIFDEKKALLSKEEVPEETPGVPETIEDPTPSVTGTFTVERKRSK